MKMTRNNDTKQLLCFTQRALTAYPHSKNIIQFHFIELELIMLWLWVHIFQKM